MKDIKSYVIGFLTCACLFLIMGQNVPPHLRGILDEEKKEGLEGRIAELEAILSGGTAIFKQLIVQDIMVDNIHLFKMLEAKNKEYPNELMINPLGIQFKNGDKIMYLDEQLLAFTNQYGNDVVTIGVTPDGSGVVDRRNRYGDEY